MSAQYKPTQAILSCFFFILITAVANAQIDTRVINYNNKVDVLLENEVLSVPLHNKINLIKVIDARDDTTGLGYYSSNDGMLKKDWPKIYQFDSLVAVNVNIQKWVSNYLSLSIGNRIVESSDAFKAFPRRKREKREMWFFTYFNGIERLLPILICSK